MNVALQLLALAIQLEPSIVALFNTSPVSAAQLPALEANEQAAYDALMKAIADAQAA